MIPNPWPALRVFAQLAEELDPFDSTNKGFFRGEEAFLPTVQGWRRWSKPSPEPELGEDFQRILLSSIQREGPKISWLIEELADQVQKSLKKPPLLVAVLRAGVPIGALLAQSLSRRFNESVPFAALSLFAGLGWDDAALEAILREYPDRSLWFVDGWTSGGGVAGELKASHLRWLKEGRKDFTHGAGPNLAVLCDPGGFARASATRADFFVPSSCFTAPATLGFSRGFALSEKEMFRVYRYPERHLESETVSAWLSIEKNSSPFLFEPALQRKAPPDGWRLHVNEVARALINRSPKQILLLREREEAEKSLAPLLALCEKRKIPLSFGRREVEEWGAIAAARMS